MTTNAIPTDEAADVLACEYKKRPKGVPSLFDLQPAIQGTRRAPDVLHVAFDPSETALVEQVIAAERLCCPTLRWDLQTTPTLALRLGARPAQLDIFEQFLTSEDPAQPEKAEGDPPPPTTDSVPKPTMRF